MFAYAFPELEKLNKLSTIGSLLNPENVVITF